MTQALNSAQAARANQAFTLLRTDPPAALRIARELVAAAPRAPDAQQLLAVSLGQTGDLAAAEVAFRTALQLAPNHPAILSNLAMLLRRAGRPAEALQCWQHVTRVAPNTLAAWIDLGVVAQELGQLQLAVQALQAAIRLKPDSVRAWFALACAQRAGDDLVAAETGFRQVLALQATHASAWVNLAAVVRLLGRPAEAVSCFEQARQLGEHSPEVLDAQVGALLDATRIDEAFALAQDLLGAHPEYAPAHTTLANLKWEYAPAAAQSADPLDEFRRAALAQPENARLQVALIGFLLEARRCEEALQRLIELRQREDHPLLISLQANALELLDRPLESAPLYAQAHQAWGHQDAAFLCAYTRHLLKCGDWQQAAQRAEEALQLSPDLQEAWGYLAIAWRLLGDEREYWLCDYERLIELMDVDVPAGQADMAGFLALLQSSLDPLHRAQQAPVRQSLRTGSQTSGRLFGRPDPQIAALQTALLRTIERWLAKLPTDPRHPFLRRRAGSVRFTGSWSVKLWTSGNHANHFHTDGWMSSAFYVSLPPSVQQQAADGSGHAGCIQFGQPPVELGLNLPPRRIITPRVGALALFPSYMWHGTVPFEDAEPRVTVAFDMLPKG